MSDIILRGVRKSWGDVVAVNDVSLVIEKGSFTTLLGPSGCGKTTLLRMVAGLEEPTAGEIVIGDRTVYSDRDGTNLSPKDRKIGLVFQSYALWPHMTVFDNIAFGLRLQKMRPQEIRNRIMELLDMLHLSGLEDRFPSELSGGQQQRVSIARMLAIEPTMLLLDEPLSNLDAKLRMDMRTELKRLHHETGITIIYVTHDQLEAMTLSTQIAVMKDGQIQQYDTPDVVYKNPANVWVAEFMGNPKMNLIPGVVQRQNGKSFVRIGDDVMWDMPDLEPHEGTNITLAVRPEDLNISSQPTPFSLPCRVEAALLAGPTLFVSVTYGDDVSILISCGPDGQFETGEEVYVEVPRERMNVFVTDSGLPLT